MGSGWKIVLLTIAFFAIVGGIVWLAGHRELEEQKPIGPKRLSSTVVEGLVYRSPKERFPRATCDACRVGKKKLGLISIGALNIIEFDNLVVNLKDRKRTSVKGSVVKEPRAFSQAGGRSTEKAQSFVDALDLKPLIELSSSKARQFAGLKISGFELNVVEGENLLPIVKAREVRDESRSIKLRMVTIYQNGVAKSLASAELKWEPRLQIVWDGGGS